MNALLIDEYSLYRSLIVEVLRFEGINVHVASDAEAVRTAIQNTQFDLVFCDLYMDGIDTLSLIAQLRERFPSLRIVALSRYSTSKGIQAKTQTDIPFCLVKPFTIEAALRMVREVVGLRSSRKVQPAFNPS
jgi:two-component system response regulator FlrC